MPPVFGPSSPSPTRLKSWAGASASASLPSASANSETSSPSSSSSITSGPSKREAARSPASSSSCVRQTKTPLPAARPSALTTHGGRATDIDSAVGTPAARITSLAKLFEPSIRAAAALGPKTATPAWRSSSPTPATSGSFRAHDDEVDLERARQVEQAFAVLGAHGMARPVLGDAGVSGRRVQLREPFALRELPGECVLAAAGADDEDLHGLDSTAALGRV